MKAKLKNPKEYKRRRRHLRVRRKVQGSAERPRVCVFRSNTHIYAQIIDDGAGRTLAAVSSLKVASASPKKAEEPAAEETGKKKKGGKKKVTPAGAKVLKAREVGRLLAEAAKEQGIMRVRFDRGGYIYHGRVAALAEAMRENGLEF